MRLLRTTCGALLLASLAVPASAAPRTTATPPHAVVAVLGDAGVDVVHREFATSDGRDVDLARLLPPAVLRTVTRVDAGRPGDDYADRWAAVRRGPLGRMRAGLYYVRGTRLLLVASPAQDGTALLDDFHGTGTTSIAAGRTTGTAPDALLVVTLGTTGEAWDWVGRQSWVDVASTSVSAVASASAGPLCDGAAGARAFRSAGHLGYVDAGNGFFETLAFSPHHAPYVVRVGGVDSAGAPYQDPDDPLGYSAHGYDVAEAWRSRIAKPGTTDEYQTAGGTSGSTPKVAARAADLLARSRLLVGDRGIGVRAGALVVGRRLPRGPLADGRLTAQELLDVQLATARPHGSGAARYATEGYGWADARAQAAAWDVLRGATAGPARPDDDRAYGAALQARTAYDAARGCALP